MTDAQQKVTTAPASSGTSVITAIITEDHIAVLDPAVPMLKSLFQYRRWTFVVGGPLGYQEIQETVWLCDFDIKDRLCCPAGLLPRVRQILREQGYRVRVEDQRKAGPRLTADESVLVGANAKMKPLLEGLIHQPLGQIEVSNYQDVLEKILLVVRLFSKARILVPAATRREAWKLWRDLEDHLDEKVGLSMSGGRRRGDRVRVATFQSTPRNLAGKLDILLLPHAETATGDTACRMIAEMQFQRHYAFVQPQRRPDSLTQIRLEQIAGPIIYRLKKPRVPVRVLILPTHFSKVECAMTPLERKRMLYCHHKARNEHIATIAQAVFSQDRLRLKELGLRNKDIRLIRKFTPNRIKVLVETPEHARELLALLPGWRLGSLHQAGMLDKEHAFTSNFAMPKVMTAVYASELNIEADLIIRATGTEWPLRVKNFPPKVSKKTPPEVLILDLKDDFHPVAQKDSERRMQEYKRQGMRVHMLQPGVP